MQSEPKQQFGLFGAILSTSVMSAIVLLSFYFFSDVRQPDTVRLTYLGGAASGDAERSSERATFDGCADSDLACLPDAIDGTLFAERR